MSDTKQILLLLMSLLLVTTIGLAQPTNLPNEIQLYASAPAPVNVVTATYSGSVGGGVYFYWVVATYPRGKVVPNTYAVVSNALTPSITNPVTIRWQQMVGATSYDVVRSTNGRFPGSCTSCAVATGVTGNYVIDTGVLINYTLSGTVSPYQGGFVLNNRDYNTARLVSNTTFNAPDMCISIGCLSTALTPVANNYVNGASNLGIIGAITRVTGTGTIGQASLFDTGTAIATITRYIGIGTLTPTVPLDIVGTIKFTEVALATEIVTPANPSAGIVKIYAKSGTICALSSAGIETCTNAGVTIEDEGIPLPIRSTLNFTGNGVSCSDIGGKTTCNILVPSNTYPIPGFNYPATGITWTTRYGGTSTSGDTSGSSFWIDKPTGNSGGPIWTGREINLPAAPFTLTARIFGSINVGTNNSWGSNGGYGLYVADSASGRISTFQVYPNPGAIYTLNFTDGGTSPTYNSGTEFGYWPNMHGSFVWFRLKDTGANFEMYASSNNDKWWLIGSVGRTSWLANPNKIGVFIFPANGNYKGYLTVDYWRVE